MASVGSKRSTMRGWVKEWVSFDGKYLKYFSNDKVNLSYLNDFSFNNYIMFMFTVCLGKSWYMFSVLGVFFKFNCNIHILVT
jgi:hypothetical protein